MKLIAIFLATVLASAVTVPRAFSDSENENTGNLEFNKFSNATAINITLPNGTKITFPFPTGTNQGQIISEFVHQARDDFKLQENQTRQIIKDCRENAKNATTPDQREQIMDECKSKLKDIREQFRNERMQFNTVFKEFRTAVINAENSERIQEQMEQLNKKNQENEQKLEFNKFSNATNENIQDQMEKINDTTQEKIQKMIHNEQEQAQKIHEKEQKLQEKLNQKQGNKENNDD